MLTHECTTLDLLALARRGDSCARDRLIENFRPVLARWAHGRLPKKMRDINETQDIVQIALLKTFDSFGKFREDDSISFRVYLKNTVLNLIRDEMRRYARRPIEEAFDLDMHDTSAPSVAAAFDELERQIAYQEALLTLPERQRTLISMRVELGMTYDRIAEEVKSTADAVRVMTSRAIVQLAKQLAVIA
jgi:RNA polymerase sigma-70 factor, ECF subfamily